MMRAPLGNWFRLLIRTRAGVALVAALLALLAFGGWRALNELSFRRDLTAAEQSLAAYDFPEAQRRFDSCLALRPNDPAVLLLAAQAYRRDGLLDEAAEQLDRYQLALGAPTPESALQWSLVQVQRGNVKQHVHHLIEEIEIRHPASEQILESLAQGCVHVYRLDEASFWTKQLLDRYPHNPVGRLLDAQTHDTLRHREQSLEILRRLLDDYPKYDRARLSLAGLLFKTREYEEAITYYRELHERKPGEVSPLLGLISSLVKLERLDEARPLLQELEAKHADNSEALLECARFAMEQKRPADAEPLLRRATRLAPFDHEIHLELATCLEQLGQTEEASEHLERFRQIEGDMKQLDATFQAMVKAPIDPEPRLEAGRICLRNGQVTEGLRWLSGVLDLVPNHRATHQALAEYYESQGDHALAAYHRAYLSRR